MPHLRVSASRLRAALPEYPGIPIPAPRPPKTEEPAIWRAPCADPHPGRDARNALGLGARLASEQVSERAGYAALAATAARGGRGDLALGGLDQKPAGAREADLDRLAGPASRDGLDVHVGLDRRAHPTGPGDRGLRVGEGLLTVELKQERRPVGDEGNPSASRELHVVEPAGEGARSALDALDVPVDPVVERQHVGAVRGDLVVLELDQVDVLGH